MKSTFLLLSCLLTALPRSIVGPVGDGPAALPAQGADTTITIRASGSTLEFQPSHVSVKTGRRVRLRFVNEGTLPHNVAVPRSDDDLDAMAVAAYQAGETGYIPMGHKDKLLAYTTLASPGQAVEVTFVVPPPGEYTFVCLFPGHSNSMLGTLRALR
jgi:plastocyanin